MQANKRCATVVLAVVLMALVSGPVGAQEEGQDDGSLNDDDLGHFLDDGEIGAGSCSPDSLAAGTLTDCRFPLTGEGWDFWSGPFGLVAMVEGYEYTNSAPCVVEASELVCRDLLVPSWQETFEVNLSGYFLDGRRPTITVDREFDSVIGIIQENQRVKSVFAGGTLDLEVFRAGSLDPDAPVEVHLRRPGTTEVLRRAQALAPGEQDGSFSLEIPEVGRFEFVSCAVDTDQSCFRTGIPTAVEALDPMVLELVEGFNNPEDERINIVFVGAGFDSGDELRDRAATLLSLDGQPIPVGDLGQAVESSEASYLTWGAFAIEPLASNVSKFNFWYVPTMNTGSPISVRHGSFIAPEVDTSTLGLGPHVVIVNITTWVGSDGSRATGELPTFASLGTSFDPAPAANENEVPSDNSSIRFGSVYLPLWDPESVSDAAVLAHEFGHALFGLRDEYEEFEQSLPTIGRPNCALDEADAEDLWGDLVGEVDPMFDQWADALTEAGLADYLNASREDVTVGYVEGGCFASTSTAVRPTRNSIMNSNIPVFGSVNRRRAQQVLDLWPEPTPVTTTTAAPPTTAAPATTTSGDDSTDPSENANAAPLDQADDAGAESGLLLPAALAIAALGGIAVVIAQRRTGAR